MWNSVMLRTRGIQTASGAYRFSLGNRSLIPHQVRALYATPSVQALHPRQQRPIIKSPELELERQILNPERAENSKSGTDDAVARHLSSYDPSTTTPEMEFQAIEEECRVDGEVDPLFISPANRDFSQLLDPTVESSVHAIDHLGSSGRGWTRKHKEVHLRQVSNSEFDQYERLLRGLRNIQKRAISINS